MREDNIRQAGWAGVIACSLVALFELTWGVIGAGGLFGWSALLPPGLRYTEFMLNTAIWTLFMALLARVSWRAAHRHLASMWLVLVSSVLLTLFTASVLLGLNPYDFGGALGVPLVRVVLYLLLTPIAFLFVVVSGLALMTTYRLREWDRPVTATAGQ